MLLQNLQTNKKKYLNLKLFESLVNPQITHIYLRIQPQSLYFKKYPTDVLPVVFCSVVNLKLCSKCLVAQKENPKNQS